MWKVRELGDKIANVVLNYTEVETKVREATNDETWGPHGTLMQEIAKFTFTYEHFREVMAMLCKRMLENNPKHWRRCYKALLLLAYLLRNGSERVVSSARDHLYDMRPLEDFQYRGDRGKDQGINVRQKAREVMGLLQDDEKIREERKKAKKSRDKYGVSSDQFQRGYGDYGDDADEPRRCGRDRYDEYDDDDDYDSDFVQYMCFYVLYGLLCTRTMPKSKRAKLISLPRTKKKGVERRALFFFSKENVRDLGFTVIIDMRTRDFGAMRSLLKILQRSFSAEIHMVYVVKPDGFWQNRRASVMSTRKYAFEVAMFSQPGDLRRHFHPMQLTTDLQGEPNHDQEAWVMMQMMMESLHNDVMDLGTRYVKWNAMLTRSGVSSLTESEIEAQLSKHLTIERLLNATNVKAFRERFREIIVELDRQNKARGIVNPDFEAEKMKLEDLIGKLDAKRKRMEGAWQAKIETLKNCLQRKQLDEKIEKLIEWYDEKADIFEREMGDVGQSLEDAKLILDELEEVKAEAKKTEVMVKDVIL
ncbi:uncharacterized protein [Oscarella lobularis]|uniref:uncharacterized protein n=1 Tax=Oscarella lobularis TaxID=121494 RepID=UPI00331312FC